MPSSNELDIIDALNILIDNASTDSTRHILRAAIAEMDRLRAVERAARSLADEITSPEGFATSRGLAMACSSNHFLIRAIRGDPVLSS